MGFTKNVLSSVAVAAVAVGVFTGQSDGAFISYDFTSITNNSVTSSTVGHMQLFMVVSPALSGQVSFTFTNAGPAASSITGIYMDDGPLLGLAQIINGPGVNFIPGATPHNLPGANQITPMFDATKTLSVEASSPTQPNGVGPGETLQLIYTLKPGETVDDVNTDLQNSSLRVGLHVQGFTGGFSEAFVNDPRPTPTPGAAVILGMGGLVIAMRRKA
jgi:hypothetical protein